MDGNTDENTDATLAGLAADLRAVRHALDAVRRENRDLRARLDALDGPANPPATADVSAPSPTPTGPAPRPMDRRRLLRDGLVAGAAATAAVAVTGGSPVAAANGSPLVLGQANTATNTTSLTVPAGAGAVVEVVDGTTPNPPRFVDDPATSMVRAATSTRRAAVTAVNEGGVGVHAVGTDGGVAGYGGTVGVLGQGGFGVEGIGGIGLRGTGLETGVSAAGSTRGGQFSSPTGDGIEVTARANHIRLRTPTFRPAPPSGLTQDAHQRGDIVMDSIDALWLCITGGTPGTWRKLGGTGTAGAFHVLPAPVRAYDSRPGTSPGQGPKTPFAANGVRTLVLGGAPTGATAALVTLLLVNAATTPGNLTIWANGVTRPQSNSVVWGGTARRFTATAVTALHTQGRVQVHASQPTDLVIDVVGYYR